MTDGYYCKLSLHKLMTRQIDQMKESEDGKVVRQAFRLENLMGLMKPARPIVVTSLDDLRSLKKDAVRRGTYKV